MNVHKPPVEDEIRRIQDAVRAENEALRKLIAALEKEEARRNPDKQEPEPNQPGKRDRI